MSQQTADQKASFELDVKDFKATLSPEEREACEITTLRDVQTTVLRIQTKQASTRTMKNLTRLKEFLEAMENNSKIIEVFLNVHPFVAFIWGPIKLLLQAASTFANAFDALLDAYQRIGESMPLFQQYQKLFEANPEMRRVLHMNFKDVFEFHSEALKFFRGRIWRQAFDALWKRFDTKFAYILNNIKQHKILLERQANLAEFAEARKGRDLAARNFESLEKEALLQRKAFLGRWLAAVDASEDLEKGQEARTSNPNSGRWLLKKSHFRSWLDLDRPSDSMLWIHGKPGSGKTVLASLIVDETQTVADTRTLCFFFSSDKEHKQTFVAMARSFLSQMLQLDLVSASALYDNVISDGGLSLNTRKSAAKFLDIGLKDLRRTYIVLDGLDECPEAEQKAICTWLGKFIDTPFSASEPNRCVILSQYDSTTRSHLSFIPAIPISTVDTAADIDTYCRSWQPRFMSKFHTMELTEFSTIAETTSENADGMFLFARLVMTNLCGQASVMNLRKEMSPNIFPKGLGQAYKRIHDRIFNDDVQNYNEAMQLLAWTFCAIKPMAWREVQGAVAIDMENHCVNMRYGAWSVDHIDLCGPLLQRCPNGTIDFVHHTARQFIVNNHIIDPVVEHVKLATKCLDYLRLPAFGPRLLEANIQEYVMDGTYSFLDYAFVNWPRHLMRAFSGDDGCTTTDPARSSSEDLLESLERFFESRWQAPRKRPKIPNPVVACIGSIPALDHNYPGDLRERLLLTIAYMRRQTSVGFKDDSSSPTLNLHDTVPAVRAQIEILASDDHNSSTIQQYYGKQLYKCPKMCCDWFNEGFDSASERDEHVAKHDRPYLCPHTGCTYAQMGCLTSVDLEKHIDKYHNTEVNDENFPTLDEDALEDEYSEKHPPTCQCNVCVSSQQRKERKAAEAMQTTPDQAEPDKDTLDDQEEASDDNQNNANDGTKVPRVAKDGQHAKKSTKAHDAPSANAEKDIIERPVKQPVKYQCHICSKIFTRKYNLDGHIRAHTDDRPFACSVCKASFHRQHDRNTHERLHSGERNFVCKGRLENGGQWGCGRRFAMAKTLGRHFRSNMGRKCLKPLQAEELAKEQATAGQLQVSSDLNQSLPPSQTPMEQSLDEDEGALPTALLVQYPGLAQRGANTTSQVNDSSEESSEHQ